MTNEHGYMFTDSELMSLCVNIECATFICSVCNALIFPKIEFKAGKIEITKESSDIHGGLGNKTIKKNVCQDCVDKISSASRTTLA